MSTAKSALAPQLPMAAGSAVAFASASGVVAAVEFEPESAFLPEHQQSLYSPPSVRGAGAAKYCAPEAMVLTRLNPPPVFLRAQVSISNILSVSVRSKPVIASIRQVCPLMQVRCWSKGAGPTSNISPRSTRNESMNEQDHSKAHQHNLYCPPAAVLGTLFNEKLAGKMNVLPNAPM
jgi:hypothetical protein